MRCSQGLLKGLSVNTEKLIDDIIGLALMEDGADVTSMAIFSPEETIRSVLVAKASGVIAGVRIAERVFTAVNQQIHMEISKDDGSAVNPGDEIAVVTGPASDVLKAERVALNFMQRMSGIATITAEYVRQVKGTGARVLDTRKTVPGLRVLDKMAVRSGGGLNHRMGLYDMAMIKDNHIDNAGSIERAVELLRQANPDIPLIVEARSIDDVRRLLVLKVDRILLDNFDTAMLREAVELVAGRIPLEASGGINLKTIRGVAETGVDYISVGDLTHSVKALDISMIIGD